MTKRSIQFRKIRRSAAENSISSHGKYIYWVGKKDFRVYRMNRKNYSSECLPQTNVDKRALDYYEKVLEFGSRIVYSNNVL